VAGAVAVGRGLQALHPHLPPGVSHGGLSPAAIFVGWHGEVQLLGGLVALLWLLSRGPFRARAARVVALVLVAVALGPDRALNAAEAVVPTFFEVLALVTAIFLARRLARGTLGAYLAVLPLALGGQTALWLARQPEPQIRLGGIVAFLLLGVPLAILAVQGARRGN
jgi:hypothetical protein